MIERRVIADLRRLPDHHAHPVVDEHPSADGGAGMDLDARGPPAPVGQPARQPAEAMTPERMHHGPMPDQGMESRVAGEHLPGGPGGGIAVEDRMDVFAETSEHEPYSSKVRLN